MAQRLIMKNFGPIKDLDLEIKDYMLFIGPQASGKSTISKAIYFFKSLHEQIIEYIWDNLIRKENTSLNVLTENALINLYGKNILSSKFILRFEYAKGVWVQISPSTKKKSSTQIILEISDNFKDFIHSLENSCSELAPPSKMAIHASRKTKAFMSSNSSFFIPAGRSLLSIYTELHKIRTYEYSKDYLLEQFSLAIDAMKKDFDKNMLGTRKIMDISDTLLRNILRINKYTLDEQTKNPMLFYNDKESVFLYHASSGQQESFWMLLFLQVSLSQFGRFIAIEEPETHLYPESQKSITELISLVQNSKDKQIIITTHSPYILASLSNLIYAHKIGNSDPKKAKKIEKRIPKELWVDMKKVGAYRVPGAGEKLVPILDEELCSIAVEELDKVSSVINEDYDYIFGIEND